MGNRNLYIIRHGETDFNKKRIVQGSGIDSSLNETGRSQARKFYDKFGTYPFDKIYISTLKRTKESVVNFVQDGVPVTSLSGLNEINWGYREGKPVTNMDQAYFKQVISEWRGGNTSFRIEGGESPEDVKNRLIPSLKQILSGSDNGNILICTHGRTLRILMTILFKYPLSSMDFFPHRNLCLYHVVHTGQMYALARYSDNNMAEIGGS